MKAVAVKKVVVVKHPVVKEPVNGTIAFKEDETAMKNNTNKIINVTEAQKKKFRTVGIRFLIDTKRLLEEEEPEVAYHNLFLRYPYTINTIKTKVSQGRKIINECWDEFLFYVATDATRVDDISRARITPYLIERGFV